MIKHNTLRPLMLALLAGLAMAGSGTASAQVTERELSEKVNAYLAERNAHTKNPYGIVQKEHDRATCAMYVKERNIDASYNCNVTYYADARTGLHSAIMMPTPDDYAGWQTAMRELKASEQQALSKVRAAEALARQLRADTLHVQRARLELDALHNVLAVQWMLNPFERAASEQTDPDYGARNQTKLAKARQHLEAVRTAALAATSLKPNFADLLPALADPRVPAITVAAPGKPEILIIGDATREATQVALLSYLPLVRTGQIQLKFVPFGLEPISRVVHSMLLAKPDPRTTITQIATGMLDAEPLYNLGATRTVLARHQGQLNQSTLLDPLNPWFAATLPLISSDQLLRDAGLQLAPLAIYPSADPSLPPAYWRGYATQIELQRVHEKYGLPIKLPTLTETERKLMARKQLIN